jgi:hypothetical protein
MKVKDIDDLIKIVEVISQINIPNYIISINSDEIIKTLEEVKLILPVVSFELPSDEIFDMPEVDLKNPLEEFYYYERPPYLKSDQKDFKERLQKALNYLKGN